MASPILFFETPNVQVGQSGASGYLLFTQSGVSVQVRNIVAYSDSDWLTLGPIDLEGLRIPYTASTNTSAQRTAVVTLQGKIAPAYQQTVEDYATIVQMSASAGAGSITPSTYSYLCKSVGETSALHKKQSPACSCQSVPLRSWRCHPGRCAAAHTEALQTGQQPPPAWSHTYHCRGKNPQRR